MPKCNGSIIGSTIPGRYGHSGEGTTPLLEPPSASYERFYSLDKLSLIQVHHPGFLWRDNHLQAPTENHPYLIQILNHQHQGYLWVHSHPNFQHLYKLTRSLVCTQSQTWSVTTMTALVCSTGASQDPWTSVCSVDRRWPAWFITTMWWSACLLNMTVLW